MTPLTALLASNEIRTALLVDDAYDVVPTAADLSMIESRDWTQFFDDLTEDDRVIILKKYPSFDEETAQVSCSRDDFVECVWELKDQLSAGTGSRLFERYMTDSSLDLERLALLTRRLEAVGLCVTKTGRDCHTQAMSADVIFIDLFLGTSQNPSDMDTSIGKLAAITGLRVDCPPLVVLMSSSSRLLQHRSTFRDRTGLFASGFRVMRKADILEDGFVERILGRMAFHKNDSAKMIRFVNAWRTALEQASLRTTQLLRTLDLPDYAQLNALLLLEEEAPLGSYLVDVFDRILQHEVESESMIINAAKELNEIDTSNYPPPYIGESPDLQHFVYRSQFQNRARLELSGSLECRVGFGDLLISIPLGDVKKEEPLQAAVTRFLETTEDRVFLVLTPACDLQRKKAKRVLLLVGKLNPLTAADWYAKNQEHPNRTPVIEFANGDRKWIAWDMKHVETISLEYLEHLLDKAGGVALAARLRDSHAIELQQKLLSDLGRVGLTAPMPATFAVKIALHLPGTDSKLFRVDIPEIEGEPSICFVGKRKNLQETKLILPEGTCDAICRTLRDIELSLVHPLAHPKLTSVIEDAANSLLLTLEQGIALTSASKTKLVAVVSALLPSGTPATDKDYVFLVTRMDSVDEQTLSSSQIRSPAIVISISDDLQP